METQRKRATFLNQMVNHQARESLPTRIARMQFMLRGETDNYEAKPQELTKQTQ